MIVLIVFYRHKAIHTYMTYIIGHYNNSVRIIDLVSHTTYVVYVNFIHKCRDLQFKVDPERQIFWEIFHDNFNLLSEILPDIKQYFGKIKRLVISRRGNIWTKLSIQQISKKLYLIIKSKMHNFMYVEEVKVRIGYILTFFYDCKLWTYFLSLTR